MTICARKAAMTLAALMAAALSTAAHAERGQHGMMAIMDFGAVDGDGDGKITMAEIEAHRAAMFAKADTNSDARLSAEELAAQRLEMMSKQVRESTAGMLKAHDTDGDGALSAAEMPKPAQAGKFFDRVDTDGDGALSEPEVAAARERMVARHGRHGAKNGSGHDEG